MYNGLLHAHSGLRWIALILLILTVGISVSKWLSKSNDLSKSTTNIFKWNTIMIHIQLLIGIVLLFISPKVSFDPGTWKNVITRFVSVEHPSMMLIAAILVTVGGAMMKRKASIPAKYKTVFIYNALALLLILAMIPWPFRGMGNGWF